MILESLIQGARIGLVLLNLRRTWASVERRPALAEEPFDVYVWT